MSTPKKEPSQDFSLKPYYSGNTFAMMDLFRRALPARICRTENAAQQFDSPKNIYVLFKLFSPRRTLSSARTLPWRFGVRRTGRWWSSTATRPRSSQCTSSAPGCWNRSPGYTCWWGRTTHFPKKWIAFNLNVFFLRHLSLHCRLTLYVFFTKKDHCLAKKRVLRLVNKLCTFKFAKFVSQKKEIYLIISCM